MTVAKSANGDVRLREVVRGSVVLETTMGDLEVGVGQGTAAYSSTPAPSPATCTTTSRRPPTPAARREKVEVRARTTMGDIAIRRRG